MYVKAVHGLALGLSGTTLPEYTNEVTASTSTHARTKFDHVCQANVSVLIRAPTSLVHTQQVLLRPRREFQSASSLIQAEHREQRGYVTLPMFRSASSSSVILRIKLGAESALQRSFSSSLNSWNSRQVRWHSSQKEVHPHESTTIAVLTWHCRHSWAVLYALLPSSSSAVAAAAAAWPTLEFEKFLDNMASCVMSVARRPMSASRMPRAADATGVVQGRGWLSVPLSSASAKPASACTSVSAAPAATPAPASSLSPLGVELNWQRSMNARAGASAAAF